MDLHISKNKEAEIKVVLFKFQVVIITHISIVGQLKGHFTLTRLFEILIAGQQAEA